MKKLSVAEKNRIVNNNWSLPEAGGNSWHGKIIRKGTLLGVVTYDLNGYYRVLTVRFENGTEEKITMTNVGADFEDVHDYEWLSKHDGKYVWYRF